MDEGFNTSGHSLSNSKRAKKADMHQRARNVYKSFSLLQTIMGSPGGDNMKGGA
jgi:hypothetical protein